MHEHHGEHDTGAAAAGAASWLIAMVLFVILAVALIVALFVWAPWDDDGATGTQPGTEQQQGQEGSDIDISGDVDVNEGQEALESPQ